MMRDFYSGLLGYFACAAFLLAVVLNLQPETAPQPVWSRPSMPIRLAIPPGDKHAALRDVVVQPVARRVSGPSITVAVAPQPLGETVATEAAAETDNLRGVVLGDVVNLRAGPSSAMAVVGAALKGEQLELTGTTESGWVEVINPDTEQPVWIHSRMIGPETNLQTVQTSASL